MPELKLNCDKLGRLRGLRSRSHDRLPGTSWSPFTGLAVCCEHLELIAHVVLSVGCREGMGTPTLPLTLGYGRPAGYAEPDSNRWKKSLSRIHEFHMTLAPILRPCARGLENEAPAGVRYALSDIPLSSTRPNASRPNTHPINASMVFAGFAGAAVAVPAGLVVTATAADAAARLVWSRGVVPSAFCGA